VLQFDTLVHYRSLKAAKLWKYAFGQINDGGRSANWTYLSHNNSSVDYSILLKFGVLAHFGSAEVRSWILCWCITAS